MADTYDVYVALERRIESYEQTILEALTNHEYTDWLRDPPSEFGERLMRDIAVALRLAHEERLRAARVALRNLVNLREEVAWSEVSNDNA